MLVVMFLIGFIASTIGAICGIGGGVLIKPLLDFFSVASVDTISFLSGITVLFMSAYSIVSSYFHKEKIDYTIAIPLAIGASIGGISGKSLFEIVKLNTRNESLVGLIQSVVLIIACIITIIYTIHPVKGKKTKSKLLCLLIGLTLGIVSSFLGIGGGPFNLLVLTFFFSLNTKQAGIYSLFIIFVSQCFSLISIIVLDKIPQYQLIWIIVLSISGILGGVAGRKLKSQLNLKKINALFIGVLLFIIVLSSINVIHYLNSL